MASINSYKKAINLDRTTGGFDFQACCEIHSWLNSKGLQKVDAEAFLH